ncbi:MAG: hypothetical protein D6732_07010 [Methanobacteriota archaeon]|nr:MAG: hypothetical protein D6732_07010 [Euryarchaeota archaeon]
MPTHNLYPKFFLIFLLIIAFICLPFFIFPNFEPLGIKIGGSEEVNIAVQTLKESYEDIQIIDFDMLNTIRVALQLTRQVGEIIVVGHGTNEGIIMDDGSIISWNKIAKRIRESPSNELIFLSCNSKNIDQYLQNRNVLSFEGNIDVFILGYSVSAKLNYNRGLINEASNLFAKSIQRGLDLYSGKSEPKLLGGCWYNPWMTYEYGRSGRLCNTEKMWDFGNLVMLILGLFFTASLPILVPYIGGTIYLAKVDLFTTGANLIGMLNGDISQVAAIGGALVAFIPPLVNYVIGYLIPRLPWYKQAGVLIDVSAQGVAITGSGGAVIALKAALLISQILPWLWWIAGTWSDITDWDDIANMPAFIFGG